MPAPQAAPRHRRKRRWPRILALDRRRLLLVFLLLAAGVGVLWLRSVAKAALPQLDGDVHLNGFSAPVLSAPVIVRRDAHGVPHIEAATQDDLFVAQGYVTAQDRLWQMDASRRAANGDLAEILGSRFVTNDKTQRVLQIRLTAQRIYDHLSPADRARLDDYARGVNLFIAQCEKSHTLPPEFRLLGYHPQAWTGADSVSVGLMMVETLDSRMTTKLTRAHVEARLLNDPQLGPQLDRRSISRRLLARPSAHRHQGRSQRPATAGAALQESDDDDDDENTEARVAPSQRLISVQRRPRRKIPPRCWPSADRPLAKTVPSAPTTGSSPAATPPAASRCSRTICTSPSRVPNTWYMADLERARLSRRRRHAARLSVHHRRPQRARRLGIHRALRRRAGSLHREARRQRQLPGQRRRNGIRSPSIAK